MPSGAGRHMLDGSLRVLIAEGLYMPTALITAAVLTHYLGASGYGLLSLAGLMIGWFEWAITAIFARATVKFVGEADNWRPVGTAVLRMYLIVSIVATVVLWLTADGIAAALAEPILANYLRLYSLEIILYGLTQAHRNILVGLAGFRQQARIAAARWLSRLVLIVILVALGMKIEGAILGSIGSVFVELAVSRWHVRPPLLGRTDFPIRRLAEYAAPLFLFSLSIRLYGMIDLFMLKLLGGTAEQAGIYSAAQNLALAPGLFTMAISPLLLATLSRMLHQQDLAGARIIARHALRGAIGLLPFAAAIAGTADGVVAFVFGQEFLPGGHWLAILIFSATGQVLIGMVTAIVTAGGRPGWTVALAAPLVPLVIIGHLLLIPRFGAIGAALVTGSGSLIGALGAVFAVRRMWAISPPLPTLARGILIGAMAYGLGVLWPVHNLFVLPKLVAIAVAVLVAYYLLGEFSRQELGLVRSLFQRGSTPFETPAKGADETLEHSSSRS